MWIRVSVLKKLTESPTFEAFYEVPDDVSFDLVRAAALPAAAAAAAAAAVAVAAAAAGQKLTLGHTEHSAQCAGQHEDMPGGRCIDKEGRLL
jgi:hypothetical protein